MTSQLQSELLKAASSTFEKLGFVFPEPDPDEEQREAPLTYAARVVFHGPVDGALDVRVSEDVAAEVAANMLGRFDLADPKLQQDALGEIANVVCGNIVPVLGRPEDVFNLDTPVAVEPATRYEPGGALERTVLELAVDEGRAELELVVQPGVPSAVA